ncbi:MAG: methyltransferase domain-containing protein [Candidatus Bathyarchaeia archaeon]|jgi:tRNA G10  N-methylase Trm11
MLTRLFISGKNWKLSLAEILAYLNAKEIKFDVHFFSKEFFALDLKPEISIAIEDLGGTIKIGLAKTEFETQIAKQAFCERNKQTQSQIAAALGSSGLVDAMAKSSRKVFFGVSVYASDKTLRPQSGVIQRFIGSTVKDELASCGKKSRFMGFSKDRRLPQLSHVEVLKKKLVENQAEVLLCVGREQTWVGTTVSVHNPFEFQKRDIYKPNQRRIFAMPPRLARIMVNLSACTSKKVLLDPFCGVGTILQEALLTKAAVVGVDANSWCVKATSENLEWLQREYNIEGADFRVLQGDVSKLALKIGQETVDCIVTEPDLGPALRQVPTGPYALKIIQKLEPLYFGFAEEAYRVLKTGGRLVLVTPYIVTRSGQAVTMPIDERLKDVGFKRVRPFAKEMFSEKLEGVEELSELDSLVEVDDRHKVGREIHIYQKLTV